MGILRTDRITGLGGANAIKGSVEMRGRQNLRAEIVNGNADFNLLDSDFTIECWLYRGGTTGTTNSLDQDLVMLWNNTNNRRSWGLYYDSSGSLGLIGSSDGTNSDMQSFHSYTFPDDNAWYHIAAVRISNTVTVYVNGAVLGSATVTGKFYENTVDNLVVGGQLAGTNYDSKIVQGFLSNVRLIIGDGIYTGNFTPPTHELTVTPNTRLLCCQSSGNILQEETGKILTPYRASFNDSFAKASTFTPNSPVGFSTTTDVGSQYGSTFDGFTNFSTSTYMVPPGGNTRERNRGRAIFAGGGASPSKDIQVVDISSGGIAQDFGDTTNTANMSGSASSSTRMLITNGYIAPASTNTIEFITIANIASSTDFGDLTVARRRTQSLSNSTRGVHVAGSHVSPTPYLNVIDYNTIATAGNSVDFGDTDATTLAHGGSVASSTRGIYSVGYEAPAYSNVIEYITIATTGNGQDFGDLSAAKGYHFRGSICDTTRGLFAGGYNPVQDTIDFVTMATTGNASDFGNLTVARRSGAGTANSIHSIFAGGYLPGVTNTIDRVLIQTTGDAADFGDLFHKTHEMSGSSDSHGGL